MNHFERFTLEPRPWIDPAILKDKFLQLSAEAHPDKAPQTDKAEAEQRFQQTNEAYNILRDTRSRLLHLMELSGRPRQEHVQEVPPVALEFFSTVAATTKRADALVKEKESICSPMLRVQLMDKVLAEIDVMQDLQARLREKIAAIEEALARIDWPAHPPANSLLSIAETAAALGFLDRWNAQLQERIGTLTF